MRCISSRFVPILLTDDQKALRVSVCKELKQQARDDPSSISNFITGDETWVYGYDLETKQELSQWNSPNLPQPKKACQVRSNVKYMLIAFSHPRHRPQGIRTPWSNQQWQLLLWGYEADEGGHSAQTSRHVEEKQMVSPPRQHARSQITRCSTILDFQKHYSDSPPPYSPDLAPGTISYSPRRNYAWKGVVLTRLRRATQKRKRLSTHSCLRTSIDALNHGKHAGIAVYMPKRTISKETVETRSYGKEHFLWSNSTNFWVAPPISATRILCWCRRIQWHCLVTFRQFDDCQKRLWDKRLGQVCSMHCSSQ